MSNFKDLDIKCGQWLVLSRVYLTCCVKGGIIYRDKTGSRRPVRRLLKYFSFEMTS